MREKPRLIEIEVREDDVETVVNEYQADNPGKAACDMTPEGILRPDDEENSSEGHRDRGR